MCATRDDSAGTAPQHEGHYTPHVLSYAGTSLLTRVVRLLRMRRPYPPPQWRELLCCALLKGLSLAALLQERHCRKKSPLYTCEQCVMWIVWNVKTEVRSSRWVARDAYAPE